MEGGVLRKGRGKEGTGRRRLKRGESWKWRCKEGGKNAGRMWRRFRGEGEQEVGEKVETLGLDDKNVE